VLPKTDKLAVVVKTKKCAKSENGNLN